MLPPGGPVERIVVVRANNIGDFLVAVPALRALRLAYPEAEISVVALPKVRPIVERLTHLVDRYLEFPGFPGLRDRRMRPNRTIRFLAWAQSQRFDLAIQMHGNGVWSNPFTSLLGARFTLGFIRPEDSAYFFGLDASLPWPECVHEISRLLRLLGTIGIRPAGLELELPIRPSDAAEAEQVLRAAGVPVDRPLVVVHPSGRFPDRTWPAERFADAAATIGRRTGAAIVVTGGPDDEEVSAAVARAAGGTLLAGYLSLPALAALFRRSALVIGNDSGPAHMAHAVDAPSVTMYGTASPAEWGPLDRTRHAVVVARDACHPCADTLCIRRIPVDAVVAAAERLLDRGSPPA